MTLEVISYQTWNINSFIRDLSPSSHCEKLIDRVELVLCVFLGDDLVKRSGGWPYDTIDQ